MRRATEARLDLRSLRGLALTLAASSALVLAVPVPAAAEEINRIVLRVNNEVLTLHDYEQRKESQVNTLLQDPRLSPQERQQQLADIGKSVMFEKFREMLLEAHARRSGVVASEREIDEAIRAIRQEQGMESEEQLEAALAQQSMTMEDLRQSMRQEIVLGQVIRKDVTAKIEVPDDELRSFYRNNPDLFRVPEERHLEEVIVLESAGTSESERQADAEAIVREVQDGGDLAAVARRYEETGRASALIDLGWLKEDELGKLLHEAAWALEVGQTSAPVEGRGGLHIMRLVEKRGGEILPFSQVESRILMRERQRRFGKALNDFMAQLIESSYIVENVPPEAIGYRALADFSVQEELAGFRGPLLPQHDDAVDEGAADAEGAPAEDPETVAPEADESAGGGEG